MPAIKKGEVLTPLRGVCDTQIRGEGIIDLKGPSTFAPESGKYIDVTLEFLDEGPIVGPGTDAPMTVYAELHLTNNYESLIEEGVDPRVAGLIVSAADLLGTALKSLVYRGGKFGGVENLHNK